MEEKMSSQPNKEIICQHISLYGRMVLVEEKNLTRAYQIRQFSLYLALLLSICQTFIPNVVQTVQP